MDSNCSICPSIIWPLIIQTFHYMNYVNVEMTVLLEYFDKHVHSIRVFEWSSIWVSIVQTF